MRKISMRSLISRLFIPSGLAVGLLILALGLLQGATIWSVAGLAVLAGLSACGWWIARFGPRRVATIRNPGSVTRYSQKCAIVVVSPKS